MMATCRQMRRFVGWWGDAGFVEMERGFGIDRSIPWDGEHGSWPRPTKVISVLTPPRHAATARRRLAVTTTKGRLPASFGGRPTSSHLERGPSSGPCGRG